MPRTPVRCWFLCDEVADRLGVTKARVQAMLRQGFFPHAEQTATGVWMLYGKDVDAVEKYRQEDPPRAGRKAKNSSPAERIKAIQRQ